MPKNAKSCRKNQPEERLLHDGRREENCLKTLEKTDLEKDLGVWVDGALTFEDHINHAFNKVNQILGLIRWSFTYIVNVT